MLINQQPCILQHDWAFIIVFISQKKTECLFAVFSRKLRKNWFFCRIIENGSREGSVVQMEMMATVVNSGLKADVSYHQSFQIKLILIVSQLV